MARYAIKEDDNGDLRLLEHIPDTRKWRRVAIDLDEESLADVVFDLLSDGDLEAEQPVIRMRADGGHEPVRAIDLVSAEQRRRLGYVISAQPVRRSVGDPAGRRRSL